MITLESSQFGYAIVSDTGDRSELIQTDYDYPSTARTFGWSGVHRGRDGRYCNSRSTDGTVDCRDCGATATSLIALASEWLDDNAGASTEDPGYFE